MGVDERERRGERGRGREGEREGMKEREKTRERERVGKREVGDGSEGERGFPDH